VGRHRLHDTRPLFARVHSRHNRPAAVGVAAVSGPAGVTHRYRPPIHITDDRTTTKCFRDVAGRGHSPATVTAVDHTARRPPTQSVARTVTISTVPRPSVTNPIPTQPVSKSGAGCSTHDTTRLRKTRIMNQEEPLVIRCSSDEYGL